MKSFLRKNIVKMISVIFGCLCVFLFVGFANIKLKTVKDKPNIEDCKNDYIYRGVQVKKVNVIVRQIYRDNQRTIQLLQIRGHEYIVYRSNHDGSPAMVHSENCNYCQNK